MDVIKKTQQLIERFNAGEFIDKTIYLNIPQVWEFSVDNEKTLVEPLIDNFEKFNSNTGWRADGGGWYDCMQALSHFSYHSTGGAFVLCDLQGGIYSDGVVLTDPVVISRTREFGPTDLGSDGIVSFFAQHRCNQFCRREWSRPASRKPIFNPQKGTTMVAVPTRHSRNGVPH